jgi:hypothetical protein
MSLPAESRQRLTLFGKERVMERMVADLAAQRSEAEALDREIKAQLAKVRFEV